MKKTPSSGKSQSYKYLFNFNLIFTHVGGVGGGCLFVFDWEGEGGGVGWALINFFSLWDGRLIEVGANSRLGAYSNKYGIKHYYH